MARKARKAKKGKKGKEGQEGKEGKDGEEGKEDQEGQEGIGFLKICIAFRLLWCTNQLKWEHLRLPRWIAFSEDNALRESGGSVL